MHKVNFAKRVAREQAKTGWFQAPREKKRMLSGELDQEHISKGIGHHMPRLLGSRNWQHTKGGRLG